MSQLRDIKRIVKISRKQSKTLEKLFNEALSRDPTKIWEPYAFSKPVKEAYAKHRRWLSIGDATNILIDGEKLGYITLGIEDMSHDEADIHVQTVKVTTKGRKLASNVLLIFPTGLWVAWYKQDGKVFVAMASAVITLLTLIAGLLAKLLIIK